MIEKIEKPRGDLFAGFSIAPLYFIIYRQKRERVDFGEIPSAAAKHLALKKRPQGLPVV